MPGRQSPDPQEGQEGVSPIQVPGDTDWSCSSSPGPQAKGCVRRGESSLLTGSPNSPWPSRSKAEEQDLQVEGDGEGQASTEEGRRGDADEGGSSPARQERPAPPTPPSKVTSSEPGRHGYATKPRTPQSPPPPRGAPPYSG